VTTDNTAARPETDREYLEAIYARLEAIETELARLLGAYSVGGLRGFRAAAKTGSANGRR
jgi:hypothetical protein